MTRPIALVGPRGSGKSSVGRELARLLARPFVDLDDLIRERAGTTIQALFEREGEAEFRSRERAALRELATGSHVVATGGGVVTTAAARARLTRSFRVVCLLAPSAVLGNRVSADPASRDRPLLAGRDFVEEARLLLTRRLDAYLSVAPWIVRSHPESPAEIARKIAILLSREDG